MNIDTQYPSKYLSVADVPEGSVVTIDRIEDVTFDDGPSFLMFFRNVRTPKGWVVNKTNMKRIGKILNEPETDRWPGRQIQLDYDNVEYRGEDYVKLRPRAVPVQAPAATQPPPPPAPEMTNSATGGAHVPVPVPFAAPPVPPQDVSQTEPGSSGHPATNPPPRESGEEPPEGDIPF